MMDTEFVDLAGCLARMKRHFGVVTDKELAEKLGMSAQNLSNYKNKDNSGFPFKWVVDAAKKHKFSLDYVLFGTGPLAVTDQFSQEFTPVPLYKARLSGGHGSLDTDDQVECNLAFRTDFIRSKGNNGNMAMFKVIGDSMEPFIYDGDVVMVDRSQCDPIQIVDGKAYAFREDDVVKVKRLSIQGGRLLATSESSRKYPPYHVDVDNFTLFGRVVWVGHEVR